MSLHTDTIYHRLTQLPCEHRVALTTGDSHACLAALEQLQARVHVELQQVRASVWCGIAHHAADCECERMGGER